MAAGYKYTNDSATAVTVTLAHAIFERAPQFVQRRYEAWSLDHSTREVVTVGSGVHRIRAHHRFVDNPTDVRTMLAHGLRDTTLTYYPDLAVTTTNYPVKLVAIMEAQDGDSVALSPDPDRWPLGEYTVTLILQATSGNLDALL